MTRHPSTEIRQLQELVEAIRCVTAGVVSFDGCTSAGKTTLAAKVAKALGHTMLDVDNYIERDRGHFVDALQVPILSSKLDCELRAWPVVLVSGVCVQEVLRRAGHRAELGVYVQRNSLVGVPSDLDFIDVENAYEPEEDVTENWSSLDHEVLAYHREHRPKTNADIVFIRVAE